MTLIIRKGKIQHGPGLELIDDYAVANKTKIVNVKLWGFERLPYGHLVVRWANGAVGAYTGPKLTELSDHAHARPGWPKPQLFNTALPYSAGLLYADDFPKTTEEENGPKRIVRHRQSGASVSGRQRRVRAEG